MKSKLACAGLLFFLMTGSIWYVKYIQDSNMLIQAIAYILSYVIFFWLIHIMYKYDKGNK